MEAPPNYTQYPRPNQPGGFGGGYRGPGVYFEMIGEAFTAIFRNPKIYIGAGGITLGMIALAYGALFITFIAIMPAQDSTRLNSTPVSNAQIGTLITLYGILFLVIFLARVLMVGVCACTIEEADTGSTSFKTLFSPFRRILPVTGCIILCQLAMAVGMVLCYVPGLYLMGVLAFAPEICLVEKLGPVESIQKSYEMIKPFAWMMVLMMFVLSLLTGVGAMACGVGLAVTIPIQYVVLGLHYREFRGPNRLGAQGPVNPAYQPPVV